MKSPGHWSGLFLSDIFMEKIEQCREKIVVDYHNTVISLGKNVLEHLYETIFVSMLLHLEV